MPEMVKLVDVSKSFGDLEVLKKLNMVVEKGEVVSIIGPSGAGKSTILRCINHLEPIDSGEIYLEGVLFDPKKTNVHKYREHIGFVFQSFNLLPRTTVMRNVMLPLVYSRTPDREREGKAFAALAAAGIAEELFHKHSNQLSGGQMQRVAIARALINDPTLILADEPTGNLDTVTGDFILNTFEKLRDQGRTIVLITHEPEVAEHADRVVHIRDGRITDEVGAGTR